MYKRRQSREWRVAKVKNPVIVVISSHQILEFWSVSGIIIKGNGYGGTEYRNFWTQKQKTILNTTREGRIKSMILQICNFTSMGAVYFPCCIDAGNLCVSSFGLIMGRVFYLRWALSLVLTNEH